MWSPASHLFFERLRSAEPIQTSAIQLWLYMCCYLMQWYSSQSQIKTFMNQTFHCSYASLMWWGRRSCPVDCSHHGTLDSILVKHTILKVSDGRRITWRNKSFSSFFKDDMLCTYFMVIVQIVKPAWLLEGSSWLCLSLYFFKICQDRSTKITFMMCTDAFPTVTCFCGKGQLVCQSTYIFRSRSAFYFFTLARSEVK